MKNILNRLINHEQLSKEEAREVLVHISEGKYNSSQIAAFITVYMMRSIGLEELEGFRDALLELCLAVDVAITILSISAVLEEMAKTLLISLPWHPL